jgi:hypothetical protein
MMCMCMDYWGKGLGDFIVVGKASGRAVVKIGSGLVVLEIRTWLLA